MRWLPYAPAAVHDHVLPLAWLETLSDKPDRDAILISLLGQAQAFPRTIIATPTDVTAVIWVPQPHPVNFRGWSG